VGTIQSFVAAKLEESGLQDHPDAMGLVPFGPKGAFEFDVADQRAGFALPYFDLDGTPTGFQRLRFENVPDGARKYLQPPESGVHIYFPRTMPMSWRHFLEVGRAKITITEGELKAASGCAHGIPTIGLPGVSCYTNPDTGGLHHQLAAIEWDERPVEIVFDSDLRGNTEVHRSLRDLARLLKNEGASVKSIQLDPASDGSKVGLDDFLVAHSAVAYNLLERTEPNELDAILEDYARRYAVSHNEKGGLCVYDLENPARVPLSTAGFKEDRAVDVMIDPSDPKGKRKIYPAKLYLEHESRLEVNAHDYVPGGDTPIHKGKVNVWTGRGCEPWPEPVTYADLKMWDALLEHLFGDDLERRIWFERWCAYPIKHPGAKMYSAAFMYSPKKGVGKTILADTLRLIYGPDNCSRPTPTQFGSDYNGWAMKEFVVVDELDTGDRRVVGSKIRGAVTDESTDVNVKYANVVQIKNCSNIFLASNHADSIEIDHDERRFFVHRIAGDPKHDDFYADYRAEYLGEDMQPPYPDGLRKLYRHFIDLDFGDFKPRSKAYKTLELEDSIDSSQGDFDHWLSDVVDDPQPFVDAQCKPYMDEEGAECDLFTVDMFYNQYDVDRGNRRYQKKDVAMYLKDHPGVVRAGRGDTRGRINTCFGKQRLFAIRNRDKWESASSVEAREHFDFYFDIEGAKK
jgi:hypothetical protein